MPRTRTKNRRAPDSREALLAAATEEFALHGFAGASVDAVAARARVNKAMIYYHFQSKHGLYVEIVRAAFTSMGARTAAIVASCAGADEKLAAFVAAISAEAEARSYLPPIMMREMADGARRLDGKTLGLMSRLFVDLRDILAQGVREGVFREVNPVFAYLSLVSPIIFFGASRPIRAALSRRKVIDGAKAPDFLAYHTKNLLHAFGPDGDHA